MLKINTISVIVMLLASAMIMPVSLSYAQGSNSTVPAQAMSNQTGTNETMTISENSTVSQTNTQAAQGVSDFVHQAVTDFKQQGDDTRKIILDCRDRIQTAAPGDISSIKNDCSIQLNAIKAKYQQERIQYHDLVKQYRQSVMVFLNDARGISVGKTTYDNAITQLGMMMHSATSHGPMMNHAATKNNTHCVNPPGGPAIC